MSLTKLLAVYVGPTTNVYTRSIRKNRKGERDAPKNEQTSHWQQYLRTHLINLKSEALKKNPWLKETGYDIRDDMHRNE